ncbi:MAG: MerR family transcriptional regulator [Candidatus Eisenbacteria bacterium]|nr:MerR family transcriptional regulator [Candidatus Eisenbacteria bacterium]
MERMLKVGELAREAGKTVRAIHIYEQMGLIRSRGRTKGRYRLFDESTLDRMNWINRLHQFGLSLTQIRDLIGTVNRCDVGCDAMGVVRDLYRERLGRLRDTMEMLQGLETELENSLLYLEACKDCAPGKPKEACVNCRRERPIGKPALVRGLHADAAWSAPRAASLSAQEKTAGETGSAQAG